MEGYVFESWPKKIVSRKEFVKLCAFGIGSVVMNSALFSTFSSVAYAHPPSDIAITYDTATKMLKAVITHPVSNRQNHFIKTVDVALNGKGIIEHTISMQDNLVNQSVVYLIPDVKPGDIVSVEAYCNISGKLKKEIKISE